MSKGIIKRIEIEKGFEILHIKAVVADKKLIHIDKNDILFIYSPDNRTGLEWPEHGKSIVLEPVRILTYSYPLRETSLKLSITENACIYIIKITIGRLHQFFGKDFGSNPDEIQSFVGSFRIKNIYSERTVTPAVTVTLHQMFNQDVEGPMRTLYLLGKFLEFLTHYMNQPKNDNKLSVQCPFINDHLEMEKIREARDLIVKDLTSPPNLKDLARLVGTNEFKLKVGFKSMFGNTVYGYLNDFRLEKARHLLTEKTHSVKEISHIIGYSNPSHFIAAYKKKFGLTPKKYGQSIL